MIQGKFIKKLHHFKISTLYSSCLYASWLARIAKVKGLNDYIQSPFLSVAPVIKDVERKSIVTILFRLFVFVSSFMYNYQSVYINIIIVNLVFYLRDRSSISGRDRPRSLKQVLTSPLRVIRDDHYKGLSRVTVSVARYKPSLLEGYEC